MAHGVEVRLLGPFEVVRDGRAVTVPRGRTRSLLAGLALAGGDPVSVETLVDQLWGADGAPATARQALQNAVWKLRRLVGPEAVVAGDESYRLWPLAQVDAVKFGRLLRQASDAVDPAGERALLVQAAALWRGQPLTGVDSPVLRRDAVPTLTERYLAALERRIDLDLAGGAPGELVAELRTLVARHPLRESLWVRLLTALAAAGRHAEALHAYEQVRAELVDQLGADPSADLRELHQRLLAAESPPDPGQPTDPDQPTDPGRPTEAAPTGRTPRQLPGSVTGFVGRQPQLDWLDSLCEARPDRDATSVVVVHGSAGVGKTALAVRWAHRIADRFPDGQFFVDLRGYGPATPLSPADALAALLRAVGVDARRNQDDVDQLAALWRTTVSGQRLLLVLVLDNARDAEQVRPLLPGSHAVVVVTSRGQLRGLSRRDGAATLPLPELTDAEAAQLLATAVGADRTAREPDAVAELSALCGGSPLALRITADLAVRRPDQPLAELAGELRTARLDALADPDDPSADPRAVISWSYRALGPDQARTLRLLSPARTSECRPPPRCWGSPTPGPGARWSGSPPYTWWRMPAPAATGSMTWSGSTPWSGPAPKTPRPTAPPPPAACSTGTSTPPMPRWWGCGSPPGSTSWSRPARGSRHSTCPTRRRDWTGTAPSWPTWCWSPSTPPTTTTTTTHGNCRG
ncbi:MAG: BTAD domain-containing putative transcriptional regulator [Micromonosporaceae bacterium]